MITGDAPLAITVPASTAERTLASAEAVLGREDMEHGAVVVDIGEHLTHLGVFMRGSLFHTLTRETSAD